MRRRNVRLAISLSVLAAACSAQPIAEKTSANALGQGTPCPSMDGGAPPAPSADGSALGPNLVRDCSAFDAASWATFNTPASAVTGNTADPGGASDAQSVSFPAPRAGFQQILSPAPAPGRYTASIYARALGAAAGQQVVLAYYHGDYPTTQTSAPFTLTTAWQRFGPFTFDVAAGDASPSLLVENVGGTNDNGLAAAETVALWGAKVEAGDAMTDFAGCAADADAGAPAADAGGPPSGLLPSKIVGEWWWPFNPPTIATMQSQAPEINYTSLCGAFSSAPHNGSVNDGALFNVYGSASQIIADIAAWKAAGKVVVGMIGGGGDTTVIANAQNASEFMSAAIPIIDQLGLQGVDFDLENTPDPGSVASIVKQLKQRYGSGFIVAMAPRPFELRAGGVYRAVIEMAGIDDIDLVQPQDYALNGDSLAQQRSYMDGDLSDWIPDLLPASKLLVGSFDPGEGESTQTAIDTFTYYRGVYPALRGGMFWSSASDGGWAWASGQAQAEK